MNNNLTPLQEVASRIYAAKIGANVLNQTNGKTVDFYDKTELLNEVLSEAKSLLEATKPEPLNWHKQSETEHHSGVENFTISEFNTGINGAPLPNIEYQLRNDGKLIGYFFDLDLAKEFIEHIRTK